MVTVGNHESEVNYEYTSFRSRFMMPQNGNGSFYWSLKLAGVKYISLCTETEVNDYKVGTPQYLWLKKELENIDRTETPWVVVMGHRPMYSSDADNHFGPLF